MSEEKKYQRWRKKIGKHHMFCPVRKKKVILGAKLPDGDIAFFLPSQAPPTPSKAWEQLDSGPTMEETMVDDVGDVAGELELRETSKGWYDVINTATGKAINTSKLRKNDAEAMLTPTKDTGSKEE